MNVSQPQDRTMIQDERVTTSSNLTMLTDPASPAAEAFRSLRSSVKFADVEPPIRSVLIADTGSGDQHGAIAANLAAALALAGDSVVLVDANLRNPQLHKYVAARNESGLADWLSADNPETFSPLQNTAIGGLRFLPAGSVDKLGRSGSTPADHLGSKAFITLLERLGQEADFLIFDAPPLSEVGDALAVAAKVDAVLLIVRSGRTKRAAAQRAKESLDRIGAHILGAVLTDSGNRFRIRG
jgi:capsular exopolysaccharide synthesis family protein